MSRTAARLSFKWNSTSYLAGLIVCHSLLLLAGLLLSQRRVDGCSLANHECVSFHLSHYFFSFRSEKRNSYADGSSLSGWTANDPVCICECISDAKSWAMRVKGALAQACTREHILVAALGDPAGPVFRGTPLRSVRYPFGLV